MISAVLFDLDGTLLDTAPDLVGALNHVRSTEGLPAVPVEEYRHCVSRGALGLITAGMPESDEEKYQLRKSLLLEYYEQNIYRATRPFDGIGELLDELDRRAVRWGVITNKMEYLAFPVLKAAGLLDRAACVVCGDTLQQSKPHPAPVALGCEILGVSREQVLMMGDDLRDLQSGQSAGTRTALATYGYLEPGIYDRDLSGSFLVREPADVLELLGPAPGDR
jgi:phosphoglycolate phosphatase